MKRLIASLLCIACLCACSAKTEESTEPQNTESTTAAKTTEAKTEAATEQTTAQESIEKNDGLRTMNLKAYIPVFDGPSYDNAYCGTIGKDGIYTITEEVIDSEDNKWGKLKSGIGWVDMSLQEEYEKHPIVISHTSSEIQYDEYIVDDSEYTEMIAFTANEKLTKVQFLSLSHEGSHLEVDKVLHQIDELTVDKPFALGVVFYGDMTTYGVSFADEDGVNHLYSIYTSGRNGTLVWEEYFMEK